jgi:predicted Fe-Mo cluster-binding NifX family protein
LYSKIAELLGKILTLYKRYFLGIEFAPLVNRRIKYFSPKTMNRNSPKSLIHFFYTLFLMFLSWSALAQGNEKKSVLAIYPFTTSRDYTYDYALSSGNAVEAGVIRSGRFTVVERNRFGSIKEEDKFKEANTSEMISKASRLGAKTIIAGHVVGVSRGNIVNSSGQLTNEKFVDISLSFKIIDVESGEIKLSEVISGRGLGGSDALALQNSYVAIDKVVRNYIAKYMPQRFQFMSISSTGVRKKTIEYLETFKIWGGSDHGLSVGDVVELYQLSYITNPTTREKVEEKLLLCSAKVEQVHSGTTSTCSVIDAKRMIPELLDLVKKSPKSLVVEYQGNVQLARKSWLDF